MARLWKDDVQLSNGAQGQATHVNSTEPRASMAKRSRMVVENGIFNYLSVTGARLLLL